jgi:hypothetical protein
MMKGSISDGSQASVAGGADGGHGSRSRARAGWSSR